MAPENSPPRHGAGDESLEKVRLTEHDSLLAALHIRDRELVSLVGGGGKTAALQLLARETHAGVGGRGRVVATTTTAMFPAQLEAIGAVVMRPGRSELLAGLNAALAGGGPVSAAREVGADGKAKGLPVDWVDEVFAGIADRVFVEADGSRGMSLKAFAAHEPQVPAGTTVIVQIAGLDALDAPLDDAHIHRAALLGAAFGRELGTPVTAPLLVDALRAQLRVLRRRRPAARLVTLLNKAEEAETRAAGLRLAEHLLEGGRDGLRPEAVVVGSLLCGTFTRCAPSRPLVSGIVLAAGRSTRMGAQKLLLPVSGRPMIQHVVEAVARSKVAETIVVIGSQAEAVRALLREYLVMVVENIDHELGMSTSLQAGLSAARPDCDAVVIVLGDQPFVTTALIDQVVHRFAERGARIVRPLIDGLPAHPVLMAAEYFPEMLALRGDVGAREILARHPDEVELIASAERRAGLDIDTREDHAVATGDGG